MPKTWGTPIVEKTVPCKWCGTPTPMTGTKLCNGCWELDTRIRNQPILATRILTEVLIELTKEKTHE